MKNIKTNPLNFFKKCMPVYIEIRSLYWIEIGKQMDVKLKLIFTAIDMGDYVNAENYIVEFESEFTQNGVPNWIGVKYAEIYKVKSMITFLV
jgi:hypothetical protein